SGFDYLEVTDCSFTDSSLANNWTVGIKSWNSSGSLIRNCNFKDLPEYCIRTSGPTSGMVIEDCQFENSQYGMGFWGSDTSGIVIRNCHLSAPPTYQGGSGFYVSSGASIEVDNCHVEYFNDAITVSDSHVVVHDSVLRFSDSDEIYLIYDYNLVAYNNTFEPVRSCVFVGGPGVGQSSFNNNHFIRNGEALYVRSVLDYWPWGEEQVFLDMTNNYWGTQDVDEISEFILDGNDPPYIVNFFVNFLPLADGPVATEAITLDGVKALYR
nr:right-handed parallel beta-helix repeat-containing protein [Candidatus Krumholzibacteria bacterium]